MVKDIVDSFFEDSTQLENEEIYDFDNDDSDVKIKIDEYSYLDEEFMNSDQYINTGSIEEYGVERVSKATGKTVINYVDNDTFSNAVMDWKRKCAIAEEEGRAKPNMPDIIGQYIILMADGLSRRWNFRSYCVDTETEALTKRGWLKYNEITEDDIILSMDVDTKELKWSKIFEIYRGQYNGLMHQLKGSTIDALVTPEHKFVTENGLKKVEDILIKEHIITNGSPLVTYDSPYSDDLVALVGWFVTEGTIETYNCKIDGGTSHYFSISQSHTVNMKYCKEIESHLNAIDPNGYTVAYRENGQADFAIKVSSIIKDQILNAITDDKELEYDFILSISHTQRQLLIDTMMKGDGTPSNRQYVQKSKEHIDKFLMLCALCGINTHVSKRAIDGEFGYSECYTVTLSDRKQCWGERVDFNGGRRSRKHGREKNEPTVPYNDVVWCPRTEYGTFMCRRGNRVYITGNTYIDEMREDAIYMAIRAVRNFDPEKTNNNNTYGYFNRVIWMAMVTRIKTEHVEHEKKLNLLKDPMYLGYEAQDGLGDNHIDKNRMISVYDQKD